MRHKKGRYGYLIGTLMTAGDFAVVNLVMCLTMLWTGQRPVAAPIALWVSLNAAYLITVLAGRNIHRQRTLYAEHVISHLLRTIGLHAAVFLTLMLLFDIDLSLNFIMRFYIALTILLGTWRLSSRFLLKLYRRHGYNYRRVIVVGGGPIGLRLISELESDSSYGYRVEAFFDEQSHADDSHYRGDLSAVQPFVEANIIDEMYCALSDSSEDEVKRMVRLAESNAIDFYYVPPVDNRVTRRFELENVGRVPVLSIRENPLANPLNSAVKRCCDILFSIVGILLTAVIALPLAIGIKLSSPGPVIFKQRRTGYRGREFTCYKFRTMRVNDESDTRQASEDDPRKTRFGDWMRHTSIDELPQLYNVLRGEMSLIGPRPHMTAQTEQYSALIDKYMVRHTIKPGITGWAQVNGMRGATDELWKMERRVEYDVWYAENWSLLLDLKIVFLTFKMMFTGDNNAF